ncbi:MAG: hypothetical protein CVU06_01735 [Bacteroidetes bacterium HGW-Bacteroidetes-22]|nr:MAG: hypothetical protein CVU06_01735 [Bacteroidetes bacterium HGW-Bacteroidetes-22]
MRNNKTNLRNAVKVVVDMMLLVASFYFFVYLKAGHRGALLEAYHRDFWIFAGIWVVVSVYFNKYNFKDDPRMKAHLKPVIVSNFLIVGLISIVVVLFDNVDLSRYLFFGTAGLVTILELALAFLRGLISKTATGGYALESDDLHLGAEPFGANFVGPSIDASSAECPSEEVIYQAIREESGEKVLQYLCGNLKIADPMTTVLATTTRFNLVNIPRNRYSTIVNLRKINDIQRINKFFETVNTRLPLGGFFAGCAETYVMRKERILRRYPLGLNYVIYTSDFIINRICPKLYVTKKIYFMITRGNNRLISKAETLGRLYSCGFVVVKADFINGLFYFIVRKVSDPAYDFHPTYGPLIRLKRIGKGGKIIGVYKMRSMHAYSEYLQKYIFDQNDLQDGGKFADDFRVTTLGKIMRKFWLDELPMIFNLLKGDMKLVGVRPLSKHYFSLYTPELQELRTKFKPGLVPPFYADMPNTLDEIMESERHYLEAYARSPFLTDWKYFWKSFFNIFFRKARSH